MIALTKKPADIQDAARRKALLEAVEALYEALRTGDVEDYLSYFAADARLTVVGNPALNPDSGHRIGRDSIGNYIRRFQDENSFLAWDLQDIVAEGDLVIVRQQVEMRLHVNGRIASFELLDHIRLRNGQIVELTQFVDTGTLALLKGHIKLA